MKNIEDLKKITETNLDKLDMLEESKLKLINETKNIKKISFKRHKFIAILSTAAVITFIIIINGILIQMKSTLLVHAESNLMEGVTPRNVNNVELSKKFIKSTADFSIDLFKRSYTKGKNSLISPPSVYLSLGMTANGADGNTLKEFENVLGEKDININELNSYYNTLYGQLTNTESSKVSIANSIWYRNDKSLNIKKDFIQTNADYYHAAAYKSDFSSNQTVNDINNWVKSNTGNNIDKIVDSINKNDNMYLINAIYFDAQWEKVYAQEAVRKGNFELADGSNKKVDFMFSSESIYLKDDKAQGFIKPYKDGKYSFVALLPNFSVNIDSYISSLSGDQFIKLIETKSEEPVVTELPIFKSEYNIKLVEPLKRMGLSDCFDKGNANFSKMGNSTMGNLYIGNVIHKTFISVDTQGTKAAAVSMEEGVGAAAIPKRVILNRPFVYAIIDNETKLPLFIGTMMDPKS
ncbi:MAG: serpin family protein [Bacillota bacterium]|nr:serpin family protein [Bacillota bacterium]